MEKSSPNSLTSFFSPADFTGLLFFHRVLSCIIGCLCQNFLSFFQSQVEFFLLKPKFCNNRTNPDFKADERIKNVSISSQKFCLNEKEDVKMRRKDVEMVMEKLEIFYDPEGEKLECMDSDELTALFDENEPSFGEVKEAFSVFDENSDGFIDPRELQRVLCNLGFREGTNRVACKSMIAAFDKNGDGQIDFNEFVKVMENSLC